MQYILSLGAGLYLGDNTSDEAHHLRDEVDKDEGDHEDEIFVHLGLEANHVVDNDCEDYCDDCLEGNADHGLGQEVGGQPVLP